VQTKQGPVWQERLQHQKTVKNPVSCTSVGCHNLPSPSRWWLAAGCSAWLLSVRGLCCCSLTAHNTLGWALCNVPKAMEKVYSSTRNCSHSSQALGQIFEAWVRFQRAMASLGCFRPALWQWCINMASQGMDLCLKREKGMTASACTFKIVLKVLFCAGREEGRSYPSYTPWFFLS